MNEYTFDQLSVGQTYEFEREFELSHVKEFAMLSGDNNPLHVDSDYASQTEFKNVVVHGMLVASLFSTLVGMYLPGKYCLYLSQSLHFKKPVFANQRLRVVGKITKKIESLMIVIIKNEIVDENNISYVSGEAMIKLLK